MNTRLEDSGRGQSPIGVNLGNRRMQGTEGEASSPLRDGMSIGTMPCRSGELASPVCPTRIEAAFRSRLWGKAPREKIVTPSLNGVTIGNGKPFGRVSHPRDAQPRLPEERVEREDEPRFGQ